MRHNAISTFLILCLSWSAAAATSNLIENSPFIPSDWKKEIPKPIPVKPPPVRVEPLLSSNFEFRGVFQMGDSEPEFNIYDIKKGMSVWLKLNERNSNYDFTISNYDRDSIPKEITLKAGARDEVITMAVSEGTPVAIQSMNTPPPAIPGMGQNVNPGRETNPGGRQVVRRRRIIRPPSRSGSEPAQVQTSPQVPEGLPFPVENP